MTTTIQLQSEQGLRGKQHWQLPDRHWLKTAEKTTVWGAVMGMVMAAAFQQAIYTLPLSLYLGLSLVNRKHWEAQMQQRITVAMNEAAQLQSQSDRFFINEATSWQQRWQDTQEQVTQVQQQLTDLNVSLAALRDRTSNLEKIEQQLAVIQKSVSASTKNHRGRVAIFIDGANLFYAIQDLGIEVDYLKFLSFLTDGSPLFRCIFYTGVNSNNEKEQKFLYWLSRNGYQLVTKELIQRSNGSKKANLDVEIVLDMIGLAGSYDTAVLVSGDGDLAGAVNRLTSQGIRVEVLGLRAMTSSTLIDAADAYINLETIKQKIRK